MPLPANLFIVTECVRVRFLATLFLLTLGLFEKTVIAETPSPFCATTVPPDSSKRYSLGLNLGMLVPNRLPDFQPSLLSYGPSLGVPLLGNTLLLGGLYGASDGISTYVFETGYRIPIETPFFRGFGLVGVHYLHYANVGHNYDSFGGNIAFGLLLAMGRDFELALSMKGYFQRKTVLLFGFGFSFFL